MCVHTLTQNSIMTSRVPPFAGWFLPAGASEFFVRAACHRSRALRFLPVTLARAGRSRENASDSSLRRKSHPRRRVPPPQAECHCSRDVCVLCWRAQIRRLRRRCWNRRTAAIAHAFARARALALRSRWQVGANTPARTTDGRCCFLAIYIAGTEFCW